MAQNEIQTAARRKAMASRLSSPQADFRAIMQTREARGALGGPVVTNFDAATGAQFYTGLNDVGTSAGGVPGEILGGGGGGGGEGSQEDSFMASVGEMSTGMKIGLAVGALGLVYVLTTKKTGKSKGFL